MAAMKSYSLSNKQAASDGISTKRRNLRAVAAEIITILLVLLFGLTALDKALHFELFYTEVGKSPFLMDYQGWVAWGTPIVESTVVVLLIANGRLQLCGLYASIFLMALFVGYIYLLLNYSYYTPCLCSAALESLTWEQHLVFNIGILLLAICAVIFKEQQRKNIKNHKS